MKTCTRCLVSQDESEFSKKRCLVNGSILRNSVCKVCVRKYGREYYRQHKERYIEKNMKYRERLRERLFEYLTGKSCIDCGESDPLVLEFDHVRGKKENTVIEILTRTTKWEKVLAEIKKCEIRCANCHRRRTMKQRNFHRVRFFRDIG